MDLKDLPALNAVLNGTSAVLLAVGFMFIRRKQPTRHRGAMLAACAVSVLFLISYLIYHFEVGSVRFQKQGAIRTFYLTVLFTHTVLAAVVAPMAVVTLARAWKGLYSRHRRLARWTLPLWLYVNLTGVLIYCMLYRM